MTKFRAAPIVAPAAAWLFGHRARGRGRLLVVASLGLGLCFAVAGGWRWWRAAHALEGTNQIAPGWQTTSSQAERTRAADAEQPSASERAAANRVIRQLNAPWAEVFATLEEQARGRVAVAAVESDAEHGVVRLTTEGPVLADLLGHAAAMQELPRFSRTQLLRVEEVDGPVGAPLSRLTIELTVAR